MAVDPPDTAYVRADDGLILATQRVGAGPELVVLTGGFSHLEVRWEERRLATTWRRIAGFATVTTFDGRGGGLSERVPEPATLSRRVDDVIAVMDHYGVEQAVIHGSYEGGAVALTLAASMPARVRALVLESTTPRALASADFPEGIPADAWDAVVKLVESTSLEELADWLAPSRAHEPAFRAWFARWVRHGSGPGGLAALLRWVTTVDVRPLLPDVGCPVTVVHTPDDPFVPLAAARYLAEHLPHGRLVEVAADTAWFSPGVDAVINVLEEVVTGRVTEFAERLELTVLFTDIVGSTEVAARVGAARWRALIDGHDAATANAVRRWGGRLVKSTGDGSLSVFEHTDDAIAAAREVVGALTGAGLELRVGLHRGDVELRGDDVGGLAVHIASRACALASAGTAMLTDSAMEGSAAGLATTVDGDAHELKGVPGRWRLHRLELADDQRAGE